MNYALFPFYLMTMIMLYDFNILLFKNNFFESFLLFEDKFNLKHNMLKNLSHNH